MKTDQIQKLLKGVCTKLTDNLSDHLKEIFSRAYITGGCIPSMLLGEYVKDYDIYFETEQDAKTILQYYEKLMEQEVIATGKSIVSFISENAISLNNKIQLILKFTGKPEIVTERFDWQHIKSYYLISKNELVMCDDIYRLVLEKELIYTGSEYPLSTLFRMKKYVAKGWKISNIAIVKIVFDIIKQFGYVIPSLSAEVLYGGMNETAGDLYNDTRELFEKNWETTDDIEPIISVEQFISQMNGVDPIMVQARLREYNGQFLTLSEIIKYIDE